MKRKRIKKKKPIKIKYTYVPNKERLNSAYKFLAKHLLEKAKKEVEKEEKKKKGQK